MNETPQLRPFAPLRKAFLDGSDNPRDYLERCLKAINAEDPTLHAFAALNPDGARGAAEASAIRYKAGKPLSPIDGMPVGIKDIIETYDMPTQMGSPLFTGWQSDHDAAAVVALREAGAVIIGKTVTTEFAATEPGPTRNPHNPDHTPGGSSSGSAAAVGAGLIPAALGTQVVGSILRPASYCGCYGFKPSVGRLNRMGINDVLSQSCLGPIAASLEDLWDVAIEIAQRVGGDAGYAPLRSGAKTNRLRKPKKPGRLIRLKTAGWQKANEAARAAFDAYVKTLSDTGVEILDARAVDGLEAYEEALKEAFDLTRNINAWESRGFLSDYARIDHDLLSATMQKRLKDARGMAPEDYIGWLERREEIRAMHEEFSSACDGFITLSATGAAPEGIGFTGDPAFNVPASLLGTPAVTLPKLNDGTMPLGVQLMGFYGHDGDLMARANWLDKEG